MEYTVLVVSQTSGEIEFPFATRGLAFEFVANVMKVGSNPVWVFDPTGKAIFERE